MPYDLTIENENLLNSNRWQSRVVSSFSSPFKVAIAESHLRSEPDQCIQTRFMHAADAKYSGCIFSKKWSNSLTGCELLVEGRDREKGKFINSSWGEVHVKWMRPRGCDCGVLGFSRMYLAWSNDWEDFQWPTHVLTFHATKTWTPIEKQQKPIWNH